MDPRRLDADLEVLPKLRNQRSVCMEAPRETRGCTYENMYAVGNRAQESTLRSIEIDRTDQNNLAIRCYFVIVDSKPTCRLNIPQAGRMQFVQIIALKLSKNLPSNDLLRLFDLVCDVCEIHQIGR